MTVKATHAVRRLSSFLAHSARGAQRHATCCKPVVNGDRTRGFLSIDLEQGKNGDAAHECRVALFLTYNERMYGAPRSLLRTLPPPSPTLPRTPRRDITDPCRL
eukprot:3015819-Prymnesium_polylepis.1